MLDVDDVGSNDSDCNSVAAEDDGDEEDEDDGEDEDSSFSASLIATSPSG